VAEQVQLRINTQRSLKATVVCKEFYISASASGDLAFFKRYRKEEADIN
jgi:hypothetical protein